MGRTQTQAAVLCSLGPVENGAFSHPLMALAPRESQGKEADLRSLGRCWVCSHVPQQQG